MRHSLYDAGRLALLFIAVFRCHSAAQTPTQSQPTPKKAAPAIAAPAKSAAAKPPIQLAIDAYLKKNTEMAEKHLRGLAEKGNTFALTLLARVCKACSEADEVRWLQSAVKQGDTKAMSALAGHYLSGRGVEKDQALFNKLQKDAEGGQPTTKVLQDYSDAIKYLSSLSKVGNRDATRELSEMYLNGWGVGRNEGEAFRIQLSLAKSGDERAQADVGELYRVGKGIGRDPQQASYWCGSAATKSSCAAGVECLTSLFMEGHGTADDIGTIERCFRDDSSRSSRLARFYVNVADAYQEGKNMPKNQVEALKWREKAAEAGSYPAMRELADAYLDGTIFDAVAKKRVPAGVQKDLVRGEYWYAKYIEQVARLKDNLLSATWMDRAERTESRGDLATAERLFKRAIEAGEIESRGNGEKRTALQALLDFYLSAGSRRGDRDESDPGVSESFFLKALGTRDTNEGLRKEAKASLLRLYGQVFDRETDLNVDRLSPFGILYTTSLIRARALGYIGAYKAEVELLDGLGVAASEYVFLRSASARVKSAEAAWNKCEATRCASFIKADAGLASGRLSEALWAMNEQFQDEERRRRESPRSDAPSTVELWNGGYHHDRRGRMHAAAGNGVPAMEDFESALRLARQAQDAELQGQVFFHKAMSLAVLGQFDSAAKECRTVVSYMGDDFVKDVCHGISMVAAAGAKVGKSEKLGRKWYRDIFDLVRMGEDSPLPPITKPPAIGSTVLTDGATASAARPVAPPSAVQTAIPPVRIDGSALAIASIRGRQHSAMPLAQALAGKSEGCELSLENGTQYDIAVYLGGPAAKAVSVPAGASLSFVLQPGQYEIAAEIPNASFQPFYGEQAFQPNTKYRVRFGVQRPQ